VSALVLGLCTYYWCSGVGEDVESADPEVLSPSSYIPFNETRPLIYDDTRRRQQVFTMVWCTADASTTHYSTVMTTNTSTCAESLTNASTCMFDITRQPNLAVPLCGATFATQR